MFTGDKYHLWVPIEDNELNKAIEVDENGDYIVQGVMTSDDKDEESDVIDPGGMDCTYFLEKGWIKYEHGNNPDQFIGEPIEIRVGRFTHPKLNKAVHGIFVKGRLFAHRELARKAVQTIQDLQKSNTKRCMGWSIEGNVVERDRKTGKILKSVLRNVVLTMNPVNTMTWVELAKSFAKNHEVTVDCEDSACTVDKSMDTGNMAEVMPQSLEGAKSRDKSKEDEMEFVKLLQKLFHEFKMNKSFAYVFLNKEPEEVKEDATHYAYVHGFSYEDAHIFGSFISDKHDMLKSMFHINGGESMSLTERLAEELEELKKSLEEEELKKSKAKEDEEEDEEAEADDEADEREEEDEEDDEKAEKGIQTDLKKSLSRKHEQAFEVSDFLADLTDEIGMHLQGLQKSITLANRKQETLLKSVATMLEAMQGVVEQMEELKAENEDLKKSLDEVLSQPIGRKSVVSGREYNTLTKSVNPTGLPLTPNRVKEVLEKSFERGELDGYELVRFEAGTPLHRLNLPASVKQELGLEG